MYNADKNNIIKPKKVIKYEGHKTGNVNQNKIAITI